MKAKKYTTNARDSNNTNDVKAKTHKQNSGYF